MEEFVRSLRNKIVLSGVVLALIAIGPAPAQANRLFDSGPSGASSGESSRLLDSGHQLAMRLFGWLLG